MCTLCPLSIGIPRFSSRCITPALCVHITGHHTSAVRLIEVQTEMLLHPAEKNFPHAPESVKGKGRGLQMATGKVSENEMQHPGMFLLLSCLSQSLHVACVHSHVCCTIVVVETMCMLLAMSRLSFVGAAG